METSHPVAQDNGMADNTAKQATLSPSQLVPQHPNMKHNPTIPFPSLHDVVSIQAGAEGEIWQQVQLVAPPSRSKLSSMF